MRAYGRTKTRRDVRKPDRNRIRTAIMKKHCAVKRRATISPRCRLLGEAPLGLATLWHCNDSGEPPAREVNAKKKPSLAEGRRRSVQRSTQTSEAAWRRTSSVHGPQLATSSPASSSHTPPCRRLSVREPQGRHPQPTRAEHGGGVRALPEPQDLDVEVEARGALHGHPLVTLGPVHAPDDVSGPEHPGSVRDAFGVDARNHEESADLAEVDHRRCVEAQGLVQAAPLQGDAKSMRLPRGLGEGRRRRYGAIVAQGRGIRGLRRLAPRRRLGSAAAP
mmetsp:Transcript_84762/g.237327  ORF Transcript_84762/g.237327 Transcript_84762/m.237327 type:complete len:277 (+) Transcript_84762:159-989(+)